MYQESYDQCRENAPAVCSEISNQLDISLQTGNYDEPTCYSPSGSVKYGFNNSLGSVTFSWEDIVWQGRDLNSAMGWSELRESLIPRAIEADYSDLLNGLYPPDDWYICGYKNLPTWTDCLTDSRCVWNDGGSSRQVQFYYTASSAVHRFGAVPCIEAITDNYLFVKDTLTVSETQNCIA